MRNFLIVIMIFFLPISGNSSTIGGVIFPDHMVVEGRSMRLRGTAVLNYLIIFKAYAGAFYLQAGKTVEDALDGNVARCLILHYFHAIKASDFAVATTRMIQKNVTTDQFVYLQPKISQFNSLYRDVIPGDRYSAIYLPGTGIMLKLNDDILGVVSGSDFSTAFFSIWIGENPIDKTFRDRLLQFAGID